MSAGGSGGINQHIHIKVNGQDGSALFFKMKSSAQLNKLMVSYCDRKSLEMSSVAFLYDGVRLRPYQTPGELDMEDGDEIDAVMHQTGGNITQTVG